MIHNLAGSTLLQIHTTEEIVFHNLARLFEDSI